MLARLRFVSLFQLNEHKLTCLLTDSEFLERTYINLACRGG